MTRESATLINCHMHPHLTGALYESSRNIMRPGGGFFGTASCRCLNMEKILLPLNSGEIRSRI